MNIVHKNEGVYIPYELTGNSLTFNEELMLRLDRYERDYDIHIDVCHDNYGNLVMGVIPGVAERYVAQIDIPARAYTETDTGETDEEGNPIIIPAQVPYSPDNTTLTLWGLEE